MLVRVANSGALIGQAARVAEAMSAPDERTNITTTLLECLQEVIAKGPGYIIHTSQRAGAHSLSDWEPSALLAEIQAESPMVLMDQAHTEWTILADGTESCSIPYGTRGSSSTRAIPGYGTLRVFAVTHIRSDAQAHAIPSTGFRLE